MPELVDLGWSEDLASSFDAGRARTDGRPGRVVAQHRGSYRVGTARGEYPAVLSGRFRLVADMNEHPAVGDWVELTVSGTSADTASGAIHRLLPRSTVLARKEPGRESRAQVLAANMDSALLLTSANDEFNSRRLERLVAMTLGGGVRPIVVLTKIDLVADPAPLLAAAAQAAPGCSVLGLSNVTGEGLAELESHLGVGRSAALIGSSGVGKSTLVNRLLGEEGQVTAEIRGDDARGRHTTTHRQLLVIPGFGCLVDTPGLREVGMLGDADIDASFDEIETIAAGCRFNDCHHTGEPGCAVLEAIDTGEVSAVRLESHNKLRREAARQLSLSDARLRSEQRGERRRFAKMVRRMMSERNRQRNAGGDNRW